MILHFRWKNFLTILGVFISSGLSLSFGQGLSIETSLDTSRIKLGEQTRLLYSLEKDKSIIVNYPDFSYARIGGIEVIGNSTLDSSDINQTTRKVRLGMNITAFDTGMFFLPPQPFPFKDGERLDTLYTLPLFLEVVGMKIDTANTIRDIKPPFSVRLEPESLWDKVKRLLKYIIPALLLIVLGYFLYRYLKKRKSLIPGFQPKKEEEPPHITALRELDLIKAQKLWQQKQVKDYYSRITHIIRWYIEKRFFVPALEQTSNEILNHIKSQKLDDINHKNLTDLLNLADLVKFAKGEPNPEENLTHLDNAYDFIRKTRADFGDVSIEGNNEIEN